MDDRIYEFYLRAYTMAAGGKDVSFAGHSVVGPTSNQELAAVALGVRDARQSKDLLGRKALNDLIGRMLSELPSDEAPPASPPGG